MRAMIARGDRSGLRPHGSVPAGSGAWTVVAALFPAATVGVYYFGSPALLVLATAVAGCVICEALLQKLAGRAVSISDGNSALIGLLLGMSLPPRSPVWLVLIGCVAASSLGRLVSGGLGFNPFHPVLAARVLLLFLFPAAMTTWTQPAGLFSAAPDAVTAATPLGAARNARLAAAGVPAAEEVRLLDALVGRVPGSIGETSTFALALGGAYLLGRGILTWQVPVSFLGSVAALAAAASALFPARFPGAGFHLVTGGLALGALFMAGDRSVAPATPRGGLVYGVGCGLLAWILRSFGAYPEGVSFAILLMGMIRPAIDFPAQQCRGVSPPRHPAAGDAGTGRLGDQSRGR